MLTVVAALMLAVGQPQESSLQAIEREIADAAAKAGRSVVRVTVAAALEWPRGKEPEIPPFQMAEAMMLSGVVYSPDGLIVCDADAVDPATDLRVTLPDGRHLKARLVGTDRRAGIAILRVDANGLVPAEFAEPGDLKAGRVAIVVGNPLGLAGSVEVGFVGGLGRAIQVHGRRYRDMVQLTTAVKPGDCGAFVANARGQFVGMVHSSFRADTSELESLGLLQLFGKAAEDLVPSGRGLMSFATPAATVKLAADGIIRRGGSARGWAGVTVRAADAETRKELNIAEGEGAVVVSVSVDGPNTGTLRRGDVVVSVDGKPLRDLEETGRWISEQEQSRSVRVVFLRDGKRREAELKIVVEGK